MSLPRFYWANGTSNFADFFGTPIFPQGDPNLMYHIKGLDGAIVPWPGGETNDPFPTAFVDTSLWDVFRIPYPATMVDGWSSINIAVNWVVADILSQPIGTKIGLGGYSQGGAVASQLYSEFRRGRLTDRRQDLACIVTFGSPTREVGHTWPGSSGYSGAFDVPNSTTGGHGAFPPLYRVQDTESFVWDFVMPSEVSTGVGDSAVGKALSDITGYVMTNNLIGAGLGLLEVITSGAAFAVAAALTEHKIVDALTGAETMQGGGGHALYPHCPPPNADGSIPDTGYTCYQLAGQHIRSVGQLLWDEAHRTTSEPTYPTHPTYSWYSTLPGE